MPKSEACIIWDINQTFLSGVKKLHAILIIIHGGSSIIVWGCFSSRGRRKLARVNEKMDVAKTEQGWRKIWGRGGMSWSKDIHVLDWPIQSSDQNSIYICYKIAVHRYSIQSAWAISERKRMSKYVATYPERFYIVLCCRKKCICTLHFSDLFVGKSGDPSH